MRTIKDKTGFIARNYLRVNRGLSLIQFPFKVFELAVLGGLLIDMLHRYKILSIPHEVIYYALPGFIVFVAWLGYIDEKRGFWKRQNNYQIKHLTPYFDKKFDELKKEICQKK